MDILVFSVMTWINALACIIILDKPLFSFWFSSLKKKKTTKANFCVFSLKLFVLLPQGQRRRTMDALGESNSERLFTLTAYWRGYSTGEVKIACIWERRMHLHIFNTWLELTCGGGLTLDSSQDEVTVSVNEI